jgi:hypothetical protein
MRALILYEDQLSGPVPKNFGPHLLVLACVSDRTGRDLFELSKRIDAYPCKGRDAVLTQLKMRSPNPLLGAELDDDRIREPLRLRADATRELVISTIRARVNDQAARVVLLVENMETLISAVCQVTRQTLPPGKPRPDERDEFLKRATFGATEIRNAVLAAMPSFRELVDLAEQLLRAIEAT